MEVGRDMTTGGAVRLRGQREREREGGGGCVALGGNVGL